MLKLFLVLCQDFGHYFVEKLCLIFTQYSDTCGPGMTFHTTNLKIRALEAKMTADSALFSESVFRFVV